MENTSVSVLLIDDEAAVAAANRAALEGRGFQVQWARTADEARAALVDGEPEAVVLEPRVLGAGTLAGFAFADHLGDLAPGVPVVLLCRGEGGLDAAALRRQDRDGWSRAERCFDKPVAPDLLAEEVEQLLAEHQRRP
jgi:DNA-binding NtrC family response regulator